MDDYDNTISGLSRSRATGEISLWHAEHLRHQRIQACVDARERNDRERLAEIIRVQTGTRVAAKRAVIGFHDGFKEVHEINDATRR